MRTINKFLPLLVLLTGCTATIPIPNAKGARTAPPPPPMADCKGASVGTHCMQSLGSTSTVIRGHQDESKENTN